MSLRELAEKSKTQKKSGRNLTSHESKRIRSYGHRAERDLVRKLRDNGFKAVRVPVSAPSSEPLPDVFATKGNCVYAFEVRQQVWIKCTLSRNRFKNSLIFLICSRFMKKRLLS